MSRALTRRPTQSRGSTDRSFGTVHGPLQHAAGEILLELHFQTKFGSRDWLKHDLVELIKCRAVLRAAGEGDRFPSIAVFVEQAPLGGNLAPANARVVEPIDG